MIADVETYALAPVMKPEDCEDLDQFLRANQANPVTLDGVEVTRMGGLSAQLILAHQRFRRDTVAPLRIANPSEAMTSDLILLGLGAVLADQEVAQ